MPNTIRDGKGRGYLVGVGDANRLDVSSKVMPRIYYASREGEAWAAATPFLTQTTTGGRMLYLKNTSTSKNMIVTKMRMSYDGGATNHDNVCQVQIIFGDGAPSGNNTVGAAGNMNRSSNQTFDIDVEYWDEGGDGMTCSGGSGGIKMMIARGTEALEVGGAMILGSNDTMTINMKAEEVGEASVVIRGFVEDK